jgi:hypothetical protein
MKVLNNKRLFLIVSSKLVGDETISAKFWKKELAKNNIDIYERKTGE